MPVPCTAVNWGHFNIFFDFLYFEEFIILELCELRCELVDCRIKKNGKRSLHSGVGFVRLNRFFRKRRQVTVGHDSTCRGVSLCESPRKPALESVRTSLFLFSSRINSTKMAVGKNKGKLNVYIAFLASKMSWIASQPHAPCLNYAV